MIDRAPTSLFQKVKHIELSAKQSVLDTFSGMYVSRFRGPGIELEEIREFQNGDDFRAISWAKSAQMGKPYVKCFRQERDLRVMLVADLSGSMSFAGKYAEKRERLCEIAALIAMSAVHNHDRVGLLLFSDHVEKFLPPKRGMKQGARVIRELLAFEPTGRSTNIKNALHGLYNALPKRAIVFLLSDFLDTSFDNELVLANKKNDLIAIHLIDPYENDLASIGICSFQDIETKMTWLVDTDDAQRLAYDEEADVLMQRNKKLFLKTKVEAIEIDTKESFLEKIVAYFLKRKKVLR